MLKFFVLILISLFFVYGDNRIDGKIVLNPAIRPDPTIDERTFVISLIGSQLDQPKTLCPNIDGSFSFRNLPLDKYLLNVYSTEYHFSPVQIALNEKQVIAKSISNDSQIAYPLVLEPERSLSYFSVREGFQVGSILKNPMILMIGGFAAIMFILPKLMGSIDPQTMAEAQQQMASATSTATTTTTDQAAAAPVEIIPTWNPPDLKIKKQQ